MLARGVLLGALGLLLSFCERCQAASACFELPILVVTPVYRNFPTANCPQRPHPSIDCMKEPIASTLEIIDHSDGSINCLSDTPTSVLPAVVHYRGQSSLYWSKHQFSVHLNASSEFLGMPSDRKFIVNGPFMDGSMLRNHLAHWLFRQTGRYSPRSRHLVVFFRGVEEATDDNPFYRGIHLLMEEIAYGPHRVGLAPLNKDCNVDEFSGGWAWQNNPLHFGDYSPNLANDQYFAMFGFGERPVLMYPPGKDLTQQMRDYFVDPTTGPLPQLYRYLYDNMKQPDDLEKYLDIGSFVDYFLHSEMSMNQDAYRRSAFFFKDRGQPINAGPVWDMNLAYGIGAVNKVDSEWRYLPFAFWRRLMCNYKFVALLASRWRALRQGPWSDETIGKFIDDSAAPLSRQLSNCRGDWRAEELPCANVGTGNKGEYQDLVDHLKESVQAKSKWIDEHIATFYKQLDPSVCGFVGEFPKYNCAANGDDDGCLKTPEKYIAAVPFPPVRQPYRGKPCVPGSNPTGEEATIDHCWMSAGVYMGGGGVTPFCAGFGSCEGGPHAVCKCVNGMRTNSCLTVDDDLAETKRQHEYQLTHFPPNGAASSPKPHQESPSARPPPNSPKTSANPAAKHTSASHSIHPDHHHLNSAPQGYGGMLWDLVLCLLAGVAMGGAWVYYQRWKRSGNQEYTRIPVSDNAVRVEYGSVKRS